MRKDRIMKSLLAASLLGALAAASSAPVGLTPVGAAGQAGKPAQAQTRFRRVRVTAADIERLPRGENYVLNVGDTARTRAGYRPAIGDLNGGVTGATKPGSGTVLTVYEFRSDRPIDFTRVVVREGADAAPVPLEAWLRKHRPAGGMRGWPFKRLLVGPPEGIAQVEGWKVKDAKPDTEYKCENGSDGDNFCGCSGLLDCTLLLVSAKCSSDMSCGDGECFCDAK
ncbi:MAG TPA: hypothetical protein VF570_19140 [Pyrinomonadaceae bacterium]|jgi:hypothetical protein